LRYRYLIDTESDYSRRRHGTLNGQNTGGKIIRKTISILTLSCLVLVSCAPTMGPKETGGTIVGAGTGALLGSQIGSGSGQLVAIAIGGQQQQAYGTACRQPDGSWKIIR